MIACLVILKKNRLEKQPIELLDILINKAVYLCKYINNIKTLLETKLLYKKYFYSLLNNSDINDEEYEDAKLVWNRFSIKDVEEYTKLY